MDRANIWSTQHLVEFVAAVGSFTDEGSAVRGALELIGEALEAELGFVLRGGGPVVSVGIPAGRAPDPSFIQALARGCTQVDAPGLGTCRVLHLPLDETSDDRIALVRQGDDPFTQTEISLAGGMAKVLTLSLRTLRLLEAERALREKSERQTREALHDSLTGLPNRGLFLERLDHALAGATAGRRVALLFLDMDGFKFVNDSLGHSAGDRLLMAVTDRFLGCVPAGGTACRLGGDEFAVALDVVGHEEAVVTASSMLHVMEVPFPLLGREVFLSASIGIAVADSTTTSQDLLRSADLAMYRAKAEGRGRYAVFESAMHEQVMRRLELEGDLRRAIPAGELLLHFQPILDLATDRVSGLEALVRWQHPTLGLLPPLDFIPMAEDTGLVVPLGTWVLEESCRQLRQLEGQHPAAAALTLSVNVSARQFRQDDLVDTVAACLASTGLAPARLTLELTETVLLESSTATERNLTRLHALGVGLSVDDFGTGYSSLGYIQRMPVDALKIDQSFVEGLTTGGVALVRAVIQLADSLGLGSTAEGVETAEQLAQLRELGCGHAQGYLIARPLPMQALSEHLDLDTGQALAFPPSLAAGLRPWILPHVLAHDVVEASRPR